jgi:spore coat polysaccharide biosynthesis protein SpsF
MTSPVGVQRSDTQLLETGRPVIAVVQARMASERLPRKALEEIGGLPLVQLVLERVCRATSLDGVVLAITECSEDNALEGITQALGLPLYRGPTEDVLRRVLEAAVSMKAETVVRVCADNPFVAPEEIDRIVTHHLASRAEYSFNHVPTCGNQYPDGLGVEVIGRRVLEDIDSQSKEPRHREHVTLFVREHEDKYIVETVKAPLSIAYPEVKLDVDTPDDLARMRKLAEAAECDLVEWTAAEVVKTYRTLFSSGPVE